MLYPARRIVTGHNAQGRSIIVSDGLATNLVTSPENPNRGLINFWRTDQTSARNDGDGDPMAGPPQGLLPPRNGTVFRFPDRTREGTGGAPGCGARGTHGGDVRQGRRGTRAG